MTTKEWVLALSLFSSTLVAVLAMRQRPTDSFLRPLWILGGCASGSAGNHYPSSGATCPEASALRRDESRQISKENRI